MISLGTLRDRILRVFLVATCVALGATANADDHGKSKQHHKGGGHTAISISPYGWGFSYQNRNFGIAIDRGGFGFAPVAPRVPYPVADTYYYDNALLTPPIYVQPQEYYGNYGAGIPVNPNIVDSQYDPSGGQAYAQRAADQSSPTIPANPAAQKYSSLAESEFRSSNYDMAKRHVNYALLEDNSNGYLWLFASHISMALGDYERSTMELGASTLRLHQNQWDFFVRDSQFWYPRNQYAEQLKSLDAFCESQNRDYGWALRGFHLACSGQTALAQEDFRRALQLNRENQLALHLQSRLQVPRNRMNPQSPAAPGRPVVPASGDFDEPMKPTPVDVPPPPPPQDKRPTHSVLGR